MTVKNSKNNGQNFKKITVKIQKISVKNSKNICQKFKN